MPFGFPVTAPDKRALGGRLARLGIVAQAFWEDPHPATLPLESSLAEWLRRHVVVLPVHQGLRPADLARIARGLSDAAAHGVAGQ